MATTATQLAGIVLIRLIGLPATYQLIGGNFTWNRARRPLMPFQSFKVVLLTVGINDPTLS